MNIFDHFPFSVLHEFNLDWIIQKIKELEARVKALEDAQEE